VSAEAYPLSWPDGWVRTRPEHRRPNNTWKKSFGAYRDDLISEVERLGAESLTLSTDIPLNLRGLPREGYRPPDPGVAMYFTRIPRADFSWQDVFGLTGSPSPSDVEHRFRELAKIYYEDVPITGDNEVMRLLLRSREAALDCLLHRSRQSHFYVLACDLFTEVRLNMHAIGLTIQAMRQIERCGASSMLERAFRGFMAALPAHASEVA